MMENLKFITTFLYILRNLSAVCGVACMGCVGSVMEELNPEAGFQGMVATSYILMNASDPVLLPKCYHKCLDDVNCMSFFYNKVSKSCQLQKNVFLTTNKLVASAGFQYYIVNGDPRCSRKNGFVMNRKIGVCFSVFEVAAFTPLETKRSVCSAVVGRMISLENKEKEKVMVSVIGTGALGKGASIGLSRSDPKTTIWAWSTGKVLTWENWYTGTAEPKNGMNDLCVYAGPTEPSAWDDSPCAIDYAHYVVCELW